ncbi:MAG: enterotoxin [Terracidiphilus sp.]
MTNGSIKLTEVEDLKSRAKLRPGELFSLLLRDGRVMTASQLRMDTTPVEETVAPNPSAARQAEQIAGRKLCADLGAKDNSFEVHWCAIVRDGTNYLRQEVTLRALSQPLDVAEVRLFDFEAPGAYVAGKVAGSPIVAGEFFFGFESPLSESTVKEERAMSILSRTLPLAAGQSITYSSVIGVAASGQLRRDFLAYLERERAHPYRTFLHYNTWYDLGEGGRYSETQALNRIQTFGQELVRKRSVTMDSFLFDDGWDNTHKLWSFNSGFPDGFTNVRKAAAQYGFGIGVWFSPWGGYGKEKEERIAAGREAGFETVKGGFALSGPRYYELFETNLLEMVTKYGVNLFKIDGTGNVNQVFPGSLFDSDFSAAIHLIERLRQQDPNIFINLTTGTWPSPFWLRYADSIWRGGEDHSFAGDGSWRQRWITYRDEQTYRNVVEGGPLFPLSSLMLHGLIYADNAEQLSTDPNHDFPDEVHSYFGSGTQLQEMYITPSLLSAQDWDVLAESARWSRSNAATLKDTHWIGGDPAKLQVYGWASWTSQKGIVVLRNPAGHAQSFSLDVDRAFELPPDAPHSYRAHSPWASDRASAPLSLRAGIPRRIFLQPFQVLVLEATPAE